MSDLMDVLGSWGIRTPVCVDPIPSHWGSIWRVESAEGSEYVLKEEKSRARALRNYDLLRFLLEHQQPVAVPMITDAGLPYASRGDRTYVLCRRLPGVPATVYRLEDSQDCLANVGEALASLDRCLRAYPLSNRFPRLDLASFLMTEAVPAITRHSGAFHVERVRRVASDVACRLPSVQFEGVKQLVHRDPNPSNFLLEEERVTGILDFGVAVRCNRLFDPCYLALIILRGVWADPVKRAAWPRVLRALMLGYSRLLDVTEYERIALPPVLMAVQFLFTAFDLKLRNVPAAQRNVELLYWLYDQSSEVEWRI